MCMTHMGMHPEDGWGGWGKLGGGAVGHATGPCHRAKWRRPLTSSLSGTQTGWLSAHFSSAGLITPSPWASGTSVSWRHHGRAWPRFISAHRVCAADPSPAASPLLPPSCKADSHTSAPRPQQQRTWRLCGAEGSRPCRAFLGTHPSRGAGVAPTSHPGPSRAISGPFQCLSCPAARTGDCLDCQGPQHIHGHP